MNISKWSGLLANLVVSSLGLDGKGVLYILGINFGAPTKVHKIVELAP